MTRINQLIAVVGGVKSDATAQINDLVARVTTPDLVTGIFRTYRARFEESDTSPQAATLAAFVGSAAVTRPADERKLVQVNAEDTLARMREQLTRLFDVTRTLDQANAGASADIMIDGKVLIAGVPTSHLLYLERELAELHEKLSRFPVLDQSEVWTGEGTDRGVWRTEPVEVGSTKPVPFNHVKFAGDAHHEPQIDVLKRDEVVGWKATTHYSGAMDPKRKRELLDRLTRLREAVKYAREEANSAQVQDIREGEVLFNWLLRA